MSDDWDSEDFVPDLAKFDTKTTDVDKWAGEDEDDNVKDNWEDDDEPKKEDTAPETTTQPQIPKKKNKKHLLRKIAEKEAAGQAQENEDLTPLTEEEKLKEKLRVQRLQESADLLIAKEMLGVAHQTIDLMHPNTEAEFSSFSDALTQKISLFQKSSYFPIFLETFLTSIASLADTEDLKKLGLIFTNLYHEKNRQLKEEKKKKQTKKKASLNVGRDDISDLVDKSSQRTYDDFGEDFM